MRQASAREALLTALDHHFDTDVAEAFTGDDEDVLDNVARLLSTTLQTAEDVDRAVARVAQTTEDHTLDWLAGGGAASPCAWLYRRLADLSPSRG